MSAASDAFEFRDGLLGDRVRGIAVARVIAVGAGDAELLVVVGDLEGRSLVDRSGQRAVLLVQIGGAAGGLRFGMLKLALHGRLTVKIQRCAFSDVIPPMRVAVTAIPGTRHHL